MQSASIDNLVTTWAGLAALGETLSEEEWKLPTALPGWSVQDNVSHLLDYESRALGHPGPSHDVGPVPYAKNALGESNEIGVAFRRLLPGAQVLDEFLTVTAAREAQLRALDNAELTRSVTTPAGPGTVADMLRLRVMDTWTHEQDIRAALGRPGHDSGPVIDETLSHLGRALPMIVGKRAGAPEGACVVWALDDRDPIVLTVVDGRAQVSADVPADPSVVLTCTTHTLLMLLTGRLDGASAPVSVSGDVDLAAAIVGSMNIMP